MSDRQQHWQSDWYDDEEDDNWGHWRSQPTTRGRRSGNPYRPSQQRRHWGYFHHGGEGGRSGTRWHWQQPSSGWRSQPEGEGFWVQTWHWQPAGAEAVPHPALPPRRPEGEDRNIEEEPEGPEVILNPYRPEGDHQPLRRASDRRPLPTTGLRPPTPPRPRTRAEFIDDQISSAPWRTASTPETTSEIRSRSRGRDTESREGELPDVRDGDGQHRLVLTERTLPGQLRPRPRERPVPSSSPPTGAFTAGAEPRVASASEAEASSSGRDFRARFQEVQRAVRARRAAEQLREAETLVPAIANRTQDQLYAARQEILIALDWHQTVQSRDGTVSALVRGYLQQLHLEGYKLAIVSFASSRQRQQEVWSAVKQLEEELSFAFHHVVITTTKFFGDPVGQPSVTGHNAPKAAEVRRLSAAVYVDDQYKVLQQVFDHQARRSYRYKTLIVQSTPRRDHLLRGLQDLTDGALPESFSRPQDYDE